MWRELLLNIICIAALIAWAVELIWLYREARLEEKDAISLVSGAAVFSCWRRRPRSTGRTWCTGCRNFGSGCSGSINTSQTGKRR